MDRAYKKQTVLSPEEVAVAIRAVEGGAFDDLERRWEEAEFGPESPVSVSLEFVGRLGEILGRPLVWNANDAAGGWTAPGWTQIADVMIARWGW